jgi:hypothetical protein
LLMRPVSRTRSVMSRRRSGSHSFEDQTFGNLPPDFAKSGIWRPLPESQKPTVGGGFRYGWAPYLLPRNWLARAEGGPPPSHLRGRGQKAIGSAGATMLLRNDWLSRLIGALL